MKKILLFVVIAFSLLSCNRDSNDNTGELVQSNQNEASVSQGELKIPSWLIGEWIENKQYPAYGFVFSNRGMIQITSNVEINIGELVKGLTIVEQKSSETEYFLHYKSDDGLLAMNHKFKFVKTGNNSMIYHLYVGNSDDTITIEQVRKK